jgi:hypothetical protein
LLESQGGVRKNYQTRKCSGADALNPAGKTPPPLYLLAITRHCGQDATAKIDNERGETLPNAPSLTKPHGWQGHSTNHDQCRQDTLPEGAQSHKGHRWRNKIISETDFQIPKAEEKPLAF